MILRPRLHQSLPLTVTALAVALLAAAVPATADPPDSTSLLERDSPYQVVDRAVNFLRTKGQAPDGSYAAINGPGVTAVVTTAILRSGRGPNDPVVAKSLR
ncbi:MAG: hypothetical protein ABIK89_17240, partial [Planctomycetota bacterium]